MIHIAMHVPRYIQYLGLPPLPDSLKAKISRHYTEYTCKSKVLENPDTYIWTDDHNSELDAWCKLNVCADMYFAFQIMSGEISLHKDTDTKTKINMVLDPGGSNVITEFYADDRKTLLDSYKIQPFRWHIFKADTYHRVINIEADQHRFAITSRVFA